MLMWLAVVETKLFEKKKIKLFMEASQTQISTFSIVQKKKAIILFLYFYKLNKNKKKEKKNWNFYIIIQTQNKMIFMYLATVTSLTIKPWTIYLLTLHHSSLIWYIFLTYVPPFNEFYMDLYIYFLFFFKKKDKKN